MKKKFNNKKIPKLEASPCPKTKQTLNTPSWVIHVHLFFVVLINVIMITEMLIHGLG